jgi:hypothetical protein
MVDSMANMATAVRPLRFLEDGYFSLLSGCYLDGLSHR